MQKKLYLNIAGFNILLCFDDEKFDPKKVVKGFIVSKAKKIDYEIIINKNFHPLPYETVNRIVKSDFFYFYKEKRNCLETSLYQNNLNQFIYILFFVTVKLFVKNGGFVFHGSAVEYKKKAYVFLGRSGAGKSTIAKLLAKRYRVIADDSIFIRKIGGKFFAFQTPLTEKNDIGIKAGGQYEVGKFFFLKKSAFTKMYRLTNKHLLVDKVVNQIFFYDQFQDKNKLFSKAINVIKEFKNFYILYFRQNRNDLERMFAGITST